MSTAPVNISGTFKKDTRPDNGLEAIAEELATDQLRPWFVVGVVVPHSFTRKPGEAEVPTVRFTAIEVVTADDDVESVHDLIDRLRKARHHQPIQPALFGGESADGDERDGDDPYDGDGFARPA